MPSVFRLVSLISLIVVSSFAAVTPTDYYNHVVFDNSIITTEMIESRLALATQPAALDWARRMPRQFAVSEIGKAALAEPRWVHLERIQCPTLLTWGRDDRVTPIDRMLVPMRLIANCETHIFPRSGHWVMIEQREAFESVVSGFLSREFV